MREIRFRGYAVEEMINSQWLYGFGVMGIDYVDGTVEWHLHTLNGTYEVYPKSIGQYTGLKDKNGREIYEGDVVDYMTMRYEVMIRNQAYGWIEDNEFVPFANMAQCQLPKLEVIGNIYENPELLESEQHVSM